MIMGKNFKGGKKHKRRKNINEDEILKKPMVYSDGEDQVYGQITKTLGSCRFMVLCSDGKERNAKLRGSLRKKGKIKIDDCVLVSLRSFETNNKNKCDIIYRYYPHENGYIKRKKFIKY